jgi:hypothetical protein
MRDAGVAAELRKDKRVFGAHDRVGVIPEKLPAPRDVGKQLGPILEPRAAYDAGGHSNRSQALECVNNAIGAHSAGQALVETNMRMGGSDGVLIPEEVRDQRRVSAASGRSGKRAA